MLRHERLGREFYLQDSLTVARALVGKLLVHETGGLRLSGKITETEAYMGPFDKAAHSCGGVPTERTKIMYGVGGFTYVYLIYGMYNCFNIVASGENSPQAVLIRAVEAAEGREIMLENRRAKGRRGQSEKSIVKNLSNGPGKLCIAMDIQRNHSGIDLVGGEIYVEEFETPKKIITTPRINIDYAEEYKDKPWRFVEG